MSREIDNPEREAILSPEETDALLRGIDNGSVKTATGRPLNGEVIVHDFAECDRLTRGAMPTLQIINTRIARSLRDSLTEFLRRPVEVETEGNFAQRFGEHMPTLPTPVSLNIVRIPPLPGTMLVVPETRLIQIAVDCFFGGKGKLPETRQAREFTQVENRMITLLLERIFAAISDGWEPIIAVEPELIGQEQDPTFASITNGRDPVIVTDFMIVVADERLRLQLIIPRALLQPVEELLDAAPRNETVADDGQWQLSLSHRLEETRIGLHSTLTQTTLRLGDVLNLQPGDVIPVELPDQVMLEAAGIPVFAARIGTTRQRNAVEIIAPAENTRPVNQN